MIKIFEFKCSDNESQARLDDFLFERIGAVSRMHLKRLILNGKSTVNNEVKPPGYKIKSGDRLKIEVDLTVETGMKPEAIPLEVLYEDEDLLIVNKPAGMLVHPTKGVKSGTLLNALSYHLNKGLMAKNDNDNSISYHSLNFIRPGLVHRLDKETSGLMVIAKTKNAHRILADHFKRKLVEKKYFALVEGVVENDFGKINAPIGQDEILKIWRVMEDGKEAETRFKVLERRADSTLLELEPVTGRTNQLRVHCDHIGHTIIGDSQRNGREFSRLCLHAAKLKFRHPKDNRQMEFESDLPIEMC